MLLILVVITTATGAWFYRQYTSPAYIRALVVSRVQELFDLPLHVGEVDFGFFRGTVLRDLRFDASPSAPEASIIRDKPLLSIDRLEVEHDPWALLFGRFRVRRATVGSPVLSIAVRRDHPLRGFELPKSKKKREGVDLPELDIANAQVNLLAEEGNRASITMSLRGRQTAEGMYDIVWQRAGEQPETGRLQIDLTRSLLRATDGGTPWLSAQTIATAAGFAGPQVAEWIERLGVRGEVRAREFTIPLKSKNSAQGETAGAHAVLECRNASLSIPVHETENDIAPADRYLQFEDIEAAVEANASEINVTASASLHGSPVQVELRVPSGLDSLNNAATAGFQAEVVARDVRFPRRGENAPADEARFVQLAPRFEKFYDEYNPEGRVDVELSLSRAPGSESKTMLDHALFHATQGAVNTKYFPYPMENVTGSVEFTSTGVYIREMCGTREGGRACLNGWLAGTKRCSATTLEIVAHNILIDEELFTGLGPRRTWIRERFSPSGRVDATVINYRPQCDPEKPAKWISDVDVFPQSASATYDDLPYPIHEITGHIKVLEDEFSLDLEGQAGRAPITIGGGGEIVDRRVSTVDLHISGQGIQLDQQLIDALPPDTGRQVAAFHAQGGIDLEARVFPSETPEKTSHRTVVSLSNIAIQHERVPLPIHDLTGQLTIEPGRVHLTNIVGRYADARIAAAGDVPSESPTEELVVGIENLTIDGNVHAAVPPELQRTLATWHVGGPIDARIVVTRPGPSDELAFRGDVLLSGNTVQPAFLPSQFSGVHGVIRFDADQVVAKEIEGRYGQAPVIANFIVQTKGGGSRGDVKLLAYGLSTNDELLSLLPQDTRDTFRRMGAAGKVDLQIDRLTYVQKSADHERLWTMQAGLRFNDAALPAIGGLRRILGTASLSGSLIDARGGTSLSGELRLQHASLFDRDLTELTTPWTFARTANGDGYLALDRMTANVYGGKLSGRTEVQFAGGRTEFSITSLIQGMSLASFINAGRRTPAEVDARGTVNANLYLTGETGGLDTLRGGGRFEIVEGWLYKLPIIIAILNVLELSGEPGDAFDEAAAEFYIAGDRVTFRDIVVKGGVLALVGEGVMTLPDLAVDFRLVNVPGSWWARLPLIEDVMKGTVREFVEIRVNGPITQPSVRTQAIPRITDEVKRLFERRRPRTVVAPGS